MENNEKEFIHCSECGKRLIARMPDGSGEFMFGKQKGGAKSPVVMKIWGIIEMTCLSWTCNNVTKLAFFPGKEEDKKKQSGQ